MKILVLTINYAPETSGFSPHVTAACEHFARQGHDVRAITGFPFAPYWKRWSGHGKTWRARATIGGVDVLRLRHYVPSMPGCAIHRLAMEGSFCLLALPFVLGWFREKWDVVFYVGAQPSIALLARFAGALYGVPYALNINDLASEAAENVGILKSRALVRLFTKLEHFAYGGAAGAMVLADSFTEALARNGYPRDRVRLIRSPIDLQEFRPVPRDPSARRIKGLPDEAFVILYAGSMGLKQDLRTVVAAANLLRDSHPQIVWVLVGEGEQKAAIEKEIVEAHLQNVVSLLPYEQGGTAELYSLADVLLLCQLASVKDSVIPSKLLTYMAAGLPVLAAVSTTSQGAELLRNSRGGWLVPPENPQALAEGATWAWNEGASASQLMGTRNRAYAEQHFDRSKITAAQEEFLSQIVSAAKRR